MFLTHNLGADVIRHTKWHLSTTTTRDERTSCLAPLSALSFPLLIKGNSTAPTKRKMSNERSSLRGSFQSPDKQKVMRGRRGYPKENSGAGLKERKKEYLSNTVESISSPIRLSLCLNIFYQLLSWQYCIKKSNINVREAVIKMTSSPSQFYYSESLQPSASHPTCIEATSLCHPLRSVGGYKS